VTEHEARARGTTAKLRGEMSRNVNWSW